MVMTIEPQIFALTKIIQKLGFSIKKIEQQPVGRHNEMEIYLDPKNDWKNSLGLSYYSNSMLQLMVMDSCVGYFLSKHFDTPETKNEPLSLSKVEQDVMFVGSVLRHEYIEKLKQKPFKESFMERILLLQKLGEIKLEGDHIVRVDEKRTSKLSTSKPFSMINFLKDMGLYLLDTYFVVLMAVQEICNANYVVNWGNLIRELHNEIKMMHRDSMIPNLQSCFKETISTALGRFVRLGLLEQKKHTTQSGSKTSFVSSPISNKQLIETYYQKLMAAKGISMEELGVWGERVSKAVEQGLIVHMTDAYAKAKL